MPPSHGSLGVSLAERSLGPLAAWFRLELTGETDRIPRWENQPSIFVMNHTAILGLEVYLLYAALARLRPEAPRPTTTVWPPFLEFPILGAFYRSGGCIAMSVDAASAELRAGRSVLILPEGPDATDIRDEVGPFHSGFLRVVQAVGAQQQVPVVPLGWAGVDEANPWWLTTHPLAVRLLMKPTMPEFDFALVPRPPFLRPSKVVFVAGRPRVFAPEELNEEAQLRARVAEVRGDVAELVRRASVLREERIQASAWERAIHAVTRTRRVAWARRGGSRSSPE